MGGGGNGRGLEGSAAERISFHLPDSAASLSLQFSPTAVPSKTPTKHMKAPANPRPLLLGCGSGLPLHSHHSPPIRKQRVGGAGVRVEPGPGWCFTGILLEGRNEKGRKQSCLWYIYTIGCKSFLMGSRVQSWGTDYQGNLDMAWPAFGPAAPSALHRGSGWSYRWRGEAEVRAVSLLLTERQWAAQSVLIERLYRALNFRSRKS